MSGFTTEDNMISREEATEYAKELARKKGLRGTFKVYYDGAVVANPEALPVSVDKTLLTVSAQLDQA